MPPVGHPQAPHPDGPFGPEPLPDAFSGDASRPSRFHPPASPLSATRSESLQGPCPRGATPRRILRVWAVGAPAASVPCMRVQWGSVAKAAGNTRTVSDTRCHSTQRHSEILAGGARADIWSCLPLRRAMTSRKVTRAHCRQTHPHGHIRKRSCCVARNACEFDLPHIVG